MSESPKLLLIGDQHGFNQSRIEDILHFPWHIVSDSIDEATVRSTVEYLTGQQRIAFFNELYRVIKTGGTARFYLPYWSSMNAVSDPFVVWPPFTELSLYYLASKEFRLRNAPQYNDYLQADFDINYGYSYTKEEHPRSDKAREQRILNNLNIVQEVVLTLTKK